MLKSKKVKNFIFFVIVLEIIVAVVVVKAVWKRKNIGIGKFVGNGFSLQVLDFLVRKKLFVLIKGWFLVNIMENFID